jgi:hypothetical protein
MPLSSPVTARVPQVENLRDKAKHSSAIDKTKLDSKFNIKAHIHNGFKIILLHFILNL